MSGKTGVQEARDAIRRAQQERLVHETGVMAVRRRHQEARRVWGQLTEEERAVWREERGIIERPRSELLRCYVCFGGPRRLVHHIGQHTTTAPYSCLECPCPGWRPGRLVTDDWGNHLVM